LVVEEALAWPQPNPRWLAVKLQGNAERLEVRLYSPAWILFERFEAGPLTKGWNQLPLPDAAARGLQYFKVCAVDAGRRSEARIGRLVYLEP
jgi:hypothetical protein